MKKFLQSLKVLLAVLFVFLGVKLSAQTTNIYESYAILSLNGGANAYYDMFASTPNPDFNGANLGNFNASNSLVVKGGENKTSKCSGGNITGGNLNYKVYLTSAGPSGGFTSVGMSFLQNYNTGCGNGDQQWGGTSGSVNIISGLTAPGNYTIEVYSDAPGFPSTAFSSNSGANYKATFTYCGPTSGPLPAGNYAIPGCLFPTVASAVTYLNANGVTGTGTVQFDVAAGYTETAPLGGISLSGLATGTSTNQIVFKKSGVGANPTITAFLQPTVGLRNDAVIKIIGGDYITFDGFTLQENSGNTTGGAFAVQKQTEMGFGIFAAAATNGAQNNTIQNCTITLGTGGAYQNAVGILSSSASTEANSSLTPTNFTGTNSNNKIYSNTISGVAYGIYVINPGISSAATYETGWDIGGSSLATANTINFGVATTADIGYTSFGGTFPAGIYFRNGAGNNVRFNNITSNNLAYVQTTGLGGIVYASGTAPSAVTYTSTISSNNITLSNTGTTAITGVDFGYGIATGTIVGSSNTITLNQNATVATSGAVMAIKASYVSATNTLNANTVVVNQTETTGALSATTIGINLAGNAATTLTANTNNITFNQTGSGSGTITTGLTGISLAGTSTIGTALNNTILFNQTTSVASGITTAITGILATSASSNSMNIGSVGNGNAITIKQGFTGSGTYGSGAITYINGTATHATLNVVGNTLDTTGSTIRSTGTLTGVFQDSTINTLVNISNNTANIDRVAATGSVIFQSTSGSPSEVKDDIKNNTITFSNLAGSTTATAISSLGGPGGPAINNKTITGNTINISGTNIGTVTGMNVAFSNTGTFTGNSVTISCAAPTAIGFTSTSSAATISGNTFNITSSTTSPTLLQAINLTGSGNHSITNNTFNALNFTGIITGAPIVTAITATGGSGTAAIFGNTISNITVGAATSTANSVIDGILIGGVTAINVYKNKIFGISTNSSGTSGVVNGIRISGGTTNNIYNNTIGALTAPASTNPDAIRGISITSSTASSTNNIYNNTVYLSGSGGTNFGGSGIYHQASTNATTAKLDLQNNLIINNLTPNGSGTAVAYRRSSGVANTLANYASTSDKNLFYAGTPGANNLIYADGSSTAQTLANYTAGVFTAGTVAPRDAGSYTETTFNPATYFTSVVGSNSNYLQPAAGLVSPAESGGNTIALTSPDYNNVTRPASPGFAWDLGAWEFAGVGNDTLPPVISYTPLTNTCTNGAVTLTASITDAGSGVPTSGAGLPVAYFKINAGTYTAATGTYVSGSTYTFNIGTGSVSGDVISYYIVAQDAKAGTPNVGAFPILGAAGFTANPPAASTPPTTPSTYTVISAVAGTATATPATLCNSGTSVISATGYGSGSGINYQWQSSTDNFGAVITDIATASSTYADYTTPTISSTMYYRLKVTCTATATSNYSTIASVTVNNPTITGVTPASICGTGTATVSATGSTGTTVSFYDAATAGTLLATGTTGAATANYTTPTISLTKTYYAEAAAVGAGTASIGTGASTSTSYEGVFYHLYGGKKSQYLILASELAANNIKAGNLTSLAIDVVVAGTSYSGFNINMKTTAATAMTTTLESPLTNVYSAASVTPTVGINTYTFSTPFVWDGTSNIIVEMCWTNNNGGGTSASVKYDNTSFVSNGYFRADNSTTICSTYAGTGTTSSRPKFTFGAQVSNCKSATRTPVVVTVTSPDAVTAYGGGSGTTGGTATTAPAVCLGSAQNLYVLQTGTTNTYTYTWSCPTAGNGLSTTTGNNISVTPTIAGTYVYTVTATDGSCSTTSTVSVTGNPTTVITVNPAATTAICVSGNATLNVTATGTGLTYQWQSSASGTLGTFVNVAANDANTGVTYTNDTTNALNIVGINAPYFYQVVVSSATCPAVTSAMAAITVNNPTVASTTPATICGPGTASLQATAGSGTLKWYAAATGGSPLGTGSPFVTPTISATTDYWVGAEIAGSIAESAGRVSTLGADGSYIANNTGIVFNATAAFNLNSAVIYPTGTGTVTIALQNSAGTELSVTSAIAVTGSGISTPVVVPIGFSVPIGTGYRLVIKSYTGITGLIRDFTTAFPYTTPSASVTGGWLSGSSATSYYFLYNLNISNGCASARTKVTATVNAPPALTLSSTSTSICSGDTSTSITITAPSPTSGYDTYTWTPSSGVSGTAATGYTFNPTATTVYTLNASQSSGSLCNAMPATFTVNVNPAPSAVNIVNVDKNICASTVQTLTATGGVVSVSILSENFDSGVFPATWTASNVGGFVAPARDYTTTTEFASPGNTWSPTTYTGGYGGTGDCLYFDSYDISGAANSFLNLPTLDLSTYTNGTFSFYVYNSSGTDTMIVQARQGINTFVQVAGSSVGTTSGWQLLTLDLAGYVGAGNNAVQIRFRCKSDYGFSNIGIDNVSVTGTATRIIWSPNTNLYTNLACTNAYDGVSSATTLYAKPTSTITYTAKATNGTCDKTDTVTYTVGAQSVYTGTWDIPPTGGTALVFDNSYSVTGVNLYGCNCTVNTGANVVIGANDTMSLESELTVNTGGTFTLESDANLIQKNEAPIAVNIGSISSKRTITIKDNTQYNYLISPLIGTNLKTAIYESVTTPNAPLTLYHNEANNKFYTSSGAYILGRGLAVKEPATGSGTLNALFTGVPMNGSFAYPLANSNVGAATELGYNLTGNPYPSNIDLIQLYNLPAVPSPNPTDKNSNNINATFYFWDNSANASGTAQQGSTYNGSSYAIYNVTAGNTGTGLPAGTLSGTTLQAKTPTNVVKVGQAFMVKSAEQVYKKLYFDNTIRVGDGGKGFFGNPTKQGTPLVDDRYRLKFAAPSNITTELAVVYFDAGTNDFAKDDSQMNGSPSDILYTIIGDQKAVINGRSTFVNTDVIPLGSNHFSTGNYTISLGTKEGIFDNGQNIYLKDKQTGIMTNLSAGSYTFAANAGESTGRFDIVYQPETVLATEGAVKENLIVYRDGSDFVVKAQSKKITSLELFDTAGRLILTLNPNSIKAVIPAEKIVNGVYVLKINQNGQITSKKIIR